MAWSLASEDCHSGYIIRVPIIPWLGLKAIHADRNIMTEDIQSRKQCRFHAQICHVAGFPACDRFLNSIEPLVVSHV